MLIIDFLRTSWKYSPFVMAYTGDDDAPWLDCCHVCYKHTKMPSVSCPNGFDYSCVARLSGRIERHLLDKKIYDKQEVEWASCQIRKLRVAHAPGIPGTFSPPHRVSDPDMHHGTCVTHVPWSMLGSLTSGFFWIRWRGKRSRHSRRMRNPPFYVFGPWGHVVLVFITGSTNLVPCHTVKSLQLIWWSGTRRWNLWVLDLQMNCRDLI